MQRPKGRSARRWAAILLAAVLSLAISPAALADTGDNTPKITKQPEQLVLQLGTRWAGVEFGKEVPATEFVGYTENVVMEKNSITQTAHKDTKAVFTRLAIWRTVKGVSPRR